MKFKMCKSPRGYFIVSEDDRDPTQRPSLLPCPFCGDSEGSLEIQNTHTPSYWVSCDCGAEIHAFESTPHTRRDLRTQVGCVAVYTRARNAAVDAWNTRDGALRASLKVSKEVS